MRTALSCERFLREGERRCWVIRAVSLAAGNKTRIAACFMVFRWNCAKSMKSTRELSAAAAVMLSFPFLFFRGEQLGSEEFMAR